MANNIPITTGTGSASVAGETVAGITYQQIEVYGGGGSSVLSVNPDGSIKTSVIGTVTIKTASVSGTVDVGTFANTIGTQYQATDRSGFSDGTSKAVPVGGIFNESISSPSSGSFATFRMSQGRGLHTVNVDIAGSVQGTAAFPLVTNYSQGNALVSGFTSVISQTTSVQVLAAPSTGTNRNYITHILVTNTAFGTGTQVNVIDQGVIIYTGYASASVGGFSATLPAPLRQPSSGVGIYVATPSQASVLVSMSGYTAP